MPLVLVVHRISDLEAAIKWIVMQAMSVPAWDHHPSCILQVIGNAGDHYTRFEQQVTLYQQRGLTV